MKRSRSPRLTLDGEQIKCTIRRSRRARHVRLTVRHDGSVLVTAPVRVAMSEIERLIRKHHGWIARRVKQMQRKVRLGFPFELIDGAKLPLPDQEFHLRLYTAPEGTARWCSTNQTLALHIPEFTPPWIVPGIIDWYKHMARRYVGERVGYWSQKMQLAPKGFSVKNQRTLWGSCSRWGNLNFNWRIMLLSPNAADYLIIHEMAHLREPNHSPRFWQLVEAYCPNYRVLKKELKERSHWLEFPADSRT